MNTRHLLKTTWRRKNWLFCRLRPSTIANLMVATKDFALKRETTSALPAVVKIDISPVCNLRCTMCIHAEPNGSELLDAQEFSPRHRMTVEQFSRIIEEIKHKTSAVSLYTWGDPMTHPDLDEMCRIASDAGLRVHISTNFSFSLSDERIKRLVESGLSHITVCVDGLSQEKYEKTRVGGRVKWVLANLERLCRTRRELGRTFPLVEVQYVKFQHNIDELEQARQLVESYGVDEFASFWGALHNLTDHMPENYPVLEPKPNKPLPHCFWPHFGMVIKYNGDVIPCCSHRAAAQHAPGADSRVFGNVFETSVEDVWNSAPYRRARRLVSNPECSESQSDPEMKKQYCEGCFVIAHTAIEQTRRWGDRVDFEDLFTLGASGRPERRPGYETGLPS